MKTKIPEIIVLDTETTGLNPEEDRICEIALLRIREGEIVEKFATLINPEIKIPTEVSFISKILDDDLKNAPLFCSIVDKVNEIIKGKIILCHNADFDISFLKKEFKRCGIEFPEIKIIDTFLIAKRFFNFESNSLSYLSHYYRIERNIEHRAEDDAKATFEIFKIFCEEIEETYPDFMEKIIFDIFKTQDKVNSTNEKISKFINEKKEIEIIYISNNVKNDNKKEITKRKILPLEIIIENGVKYLKAYCYLRKEERKFRFDKIIEILDN